MNSHQTRRRGAAFYSEEWEERGGGTEPRGAVVSITRALVPRLDAKNKGARRPKPLVTAGFLREPQRNGWRRGAIACGRERRK